MGRFIVNVLFLSQSPRVGWGQSFVPLRRYSGGIVVYDSVHCNCSSFGGDEQSKHPQATLEKRLDDGPVPVWCVRSPLGSRAHSQGVASCESLQRFPYPVTFQRPEMKGSPCAFLWPYLASMQCGYEATNACFASLFSSRACRARDETANLNLSFPHSWCIERMDFGNLIDVSITVNYNANFVTP